VVAALVVSIGFTVPLMQDGAIDALNATSAP
jgi:Na+/serine symporter